MTELWFLSMIHILDKINGSLVKAEILPLDKSLIPPKKDGWSFNWRQLFKQGNVFILRTLDSLKIVEGALCLKLVHDMLIMEALELAPHNIGQKDKRYDYVAGSLIAFGCRESFKIEGDYKVFLTFVSKSNLIRWYSEKYGAELALGQRMFIDWESGESLIETY